MLDELERLNLLRHPAGSSVGSPRQRAAALLNELALLTLFKSTTTFWRGHTKASYLIKPSILRAPNAPRSAAAVERRVEGALEALSKARHVWRDGVELRSLSSLDNLALLQHFGARTPLLDLTADPLIALYFACRRHDDADGLVVGWNAVRWADLADTTESYATVVSKLGSEGRLGWFVPPVVTDRIVVQRSRMLMAPTVPSPRSEWSASIARIRLPELPPEWSSDQLEALFEGKGQGRRAMPSIVAFRVNGGLKAYLREILATNYGIGHRTMFPDPAGHAGGV